MKARLLRRTAAAEGLATVAIGGTEVHAIDRLHLGRSTQPPPELGAEFEPSFSYQLEEGSEPRLLTAVDGPAERLRWLDGCAYEATARILSVDTVVDRRVQVAKVTCIGCVLPAPMDVADPSWIGRYVTFRINQLEVWRA